MSISEYDDLAPVNSTMHNLDDLEDYSLLENEELANKDEEVDFDESDESNFNRPSKPYEKTTSKTKHGRKTFDSADDDLREMTKITKLNTMRSKEDDEALSSSSSCNKKSRKLTRNDYWSSGNSLNSVSDNDGFFETDLEEMFSKNKIKGQHWKKFVTSSAKPMNAANGRVLTGQDLSQIFEELNVINNKLMGEYKILQEREKALEKKELKLREDEDRLIKLTQLDAKLRFEEIKMKYEAELNDLKSELKEKNKENKRLNEAYKLSKQSNENLRLQLNDKQEKNSKMEKQLNSLNNRLVNLQKKIEFNQQAKSTTQTTTTMPIYQIPQQQKSITTTTTSKASNTKICTITQNSGLNNVVLDSFSILLDWISQAHLKTCVNFNLPLSGDLKVIEKSMRILPVLAELLIQFNNNNNNDQLKKTLKSQQSFLEFIYWSLLHFDSSLQNQKVNMSSTLRRIGEEIYKSFEKNQPSELSDGALVPLKSSSEKLKDSDTNKDNNNNRPTKSLFLFSDNFKIRLLSCLIVLRTLNQADFIQNVFEVLKQDLKNDEAKKLFLDHFSTWTILKWCKSTNKFLLGLAIDIYLILSIDWECLDKFLESCSNEAWFSHVSLIFKTTPANNSSSSSSLLSSAVTSTTAAIFQLDVKIVEKLSILLQKLSKIKSNKKYFEMFGLNKVCNELLQKYYYESNFLAMNLKSILINLS